MTILPSWAPYRDVVALDRATEPHRSDRLTVRIFRWGQHSRGTSVYWAYRMADMVWTRFIVGAELPASVKAGPGLRLRHWGRGIILHPKAVLGARVTLFHRVTIGQGPDGRVPVLGDDVYVGAGATILGGVVIGDGAVIGAGTVVTKSVPPGARVVGASMRLLA